DSELASPPPRTASVADAVAPAPPPRRAVAEPAQPAVAAPPAPPAPELQAPVAPVAQVSSLDADGWVDLVASLGLRGPVRELASHASFVGWTDGVLRLSLPASDDHLKAPFLVSQLAGALAPSLGGEPQVRFEDGAKAAGETLHERKERQRDTRQAEAESAFLSDPDVQRLMRQQGAKLVPDSIRPFDEG
ncbi:MAG TPA: DNA polymerase III subunit gamma/tau C-terminal domain-containing protein, partial [Luteimonas sp.]|nr:DNA polymerase III subunit gamma/tau C-terminal domain-containing protein [Luteimonas sp.]